jgi:phospholipid transport system substrate-binding protein
MGMQIDRRNVLSQMGLAVISGAMFGLTPEQSHALAADQATTHVQTIVNEVSALLDSSDDSTAKAIRLRQIMEQRAAMPQIARFAAGTAWRGMNADQQTRFVDAFSKFISTIYFGRFQEYVSVGMSVESFKIGRVIDAGRKGMLVKTNILQNGKAPVSVEWLVTDQPGRVLIADIVVEGISLLVTQREEIGGMLEARHGDVERLIADLNA